MGGTGEAEDDSLLFEPLDFSELHELLQQAQRDDAGGDQLAAALRMGVTDTERAAVDVDRQLEVLERNSLADYVAGTQSFEDLHQEIKATKGVLAKMEKMLGAYQSDLSGIADELKSLQGDCLGLNVKLRNRKALQTLMSDYVSSVVISQELIKQICEDEINENYLACIGDLKSKLDHVKKQELQKLPSAQTSNSELEKLHHVAVSRIRDFLVENINSLQRPKTNLQIIQNNVLLRFKFFNVFLAEHHPQVAEEVQRHYVMTMSAIYLKQFKTYVTYLQRLDSEYMPTKTDLLVSVEARSIFDGIASSLKGAQPKEKGNVFSLSDRDAILKELDKDPIIVQMQVTKGKYFQEQLFRSHQMLLMDTATSEFMFLNDFFNLQGDHRLFLEVLGKTTHFFLDNLESFLANCWDSIGLLLMIRIVEWYRQSMRQRPVSRCLDSYLEQLDMLLWPRLRVVLDTNVGSLRKAREQNLTECKNTQPQPVTRRYAEFAATLHALSPAEATPNAEPNLFVPLRTMQVEMKNLLQGLSTKFDAENSSVFLVNNYDLVLTVFHERQLPREATGTFEELLRERVKLFVENQLGRHYPELVGFVKAAEAALADVDEASVKARGSPPAGVDVQRMQQVVRSFSGNWKAAMDRVHHYIMASFANFSTGMEILKQVLTQLLLYYTRLQKVIDRSYPGQRPAFAHELVPNSTILVEIKQYSKNF
eukprot:TRINITY_DN59268_c0_g1_i2.p1 TRINITY_DN59268_c0_g1~~TRINITY_DN59268_c0_g1_i2.p1  ORF type:complete len:707 (-),score=206.27 TRINITY_DN59268_c0_g1_i2:44-2164(-)